MWTDFIQQIEALKRKEAKHPLKKGRICTQIGFRLELQHSLFIPLVSSLLAYSMDFELAILQNYVTQFLKVTLSLHLHAHTHSTEHT